MATKIYEMIDLKGKNGNAFVVLNYVRGILCENGMKNKVGSFLERATSGDYAKLIGESYLMIMEVNRVNERKAKKSEKK